MIIRGTRFRLGLMIVLAVASLGSECHFKVNDSEVVKDPSKNLEKQQQCMAHCSEMYCDKSGSCHSQENLNQCNKQCSDAYPT